MNKVLALIFSAFVSLNSFSADLSDAVKMQNKSFNDSQSIKDVDKRKEETKALFAKKREDQFYAFFQEAKKSGLKLIEPKIWIDKVNMQRQRSNSCCQIYVRGKQDAGLFVNLEGGGAFSIDGYGLISTSGIIDDREFESTGKLTENCKYEVNLSYQNSRYYSCGDYLNGKVDKTVVADLKEMLVKAMQDYRR